MNKKAIQRLGIGAVIAVFAGAILLLLAPAASADNGFADPLFQAQWAKYDNAVKQGTDKQHSWVYGPNPGQSRTETYAEAPGGQRLVQYFDKARMELTRRPSNPNAVTAGLLTVELVSGNRQEGDNVFVPGTPANVPVAGDSDDPNGPTYKDFAPKATLVGSTNGVAKNTLPITEGYGHNGVIPLFSPRPVTATNAYYIQETGHNIPDIFINWLQAYQQQRGGNWIEVMGFPITEAYWANVKVGGVQKIVLMQLFQRRVLTFTSTNNPPYQVEFGNIGLHYYAWRYPSTGTPSPTTVPATTTVPSGTTVPPATNTPAPTNTPTPTGNYAVENPYLFMADGVYSVAGFIRNTSSTPLNLTDFNVTFYDNNNQPIPDGTDDIPDSMRIPAGGRIPFRFNTGTSVNPAHIVYNATLEALDSATAAGFTTAFGITKKTVLVDDGGTNFNDKDYTASITVVNNSGSNVTDVEAFIVVYDAAGHVIDALPATLGDMDSGASADDDEPITDTLPAAADHVDVFVTAVKD